MPERSQVRRCAKCGKPVIGGFVHEECRDDYVEIGKQNKEMNNFIELFKKKKKGTLS